MEEEQRQLQTNESPFDDEDNSVMDDSKEDEQTIDPEPRYDQINLRVTSQSGEEVFFKARRTTKLSKLMAAFSNKCGTSLDSVRFLYNGYRIIGHETPKTLDMEDNDVIDCVMSQVGG